MIPDGKWRRYHAVFNIQDKADSENVNLGTINSIKFYINGPGAGVDIFLDDVHFNYYERDRSWVSFHLKLPSDSEISILPTEWVSQSFCYSVLGPWSKPAYQRT